MLSLETFLLSLSVSFSLLLVDLVFILEAILRLIESDLNGDEIRLHAMDHVLVLPLHHHFVVVGLFDLVQLILRRRQPSRLLHHCLLDRVLLSLRLLQFSLNITRGQTQIMLLITLTFLVSSSFSLERTVMWMLSYFMRMRLRVALTSLFSSSPNSHDGITLLGSRRVFDGTKEY